jgi:hypothetical protein
VESTELRSRRLTCNRPLRLANSGGDSIEAPTAAGHGSGGGFRANADDGKVSAIVASKEKKRSLDKLVRRALHLETDQRFCTPTVECCLLPRRRRGRNLSFDFNNASLHPSGLHRTLRNDLAAASRVLKSSSKKPGLADAGGHSQRRRRNANSLVRISCLRKAISGQEIFVTLAACGPFCPRTISNST